MPYIFGKLWHLAIIWAIRKAFQCILQGVRYLLAKQTRLSGTSDNESYTGKYENFIFNAMRSRLKNFFCKIYSTPACSGRFGQFFSSKVDGFQIGQKILLHIFDSSPVDVWSCGRLRKESGWSLSTVQCSAFINLVDSGACWPWGVNSECK